ALLTQGARCRAAAVVAGPPGRRAGSARLRSREGARIDRPGAEPRYRDPFGKPGLLIALTDFHVLQGFRPAEEAAATLSALDVDGLDPLIEALQGGRPTGGGFLR